MHQVAVEQVDWNISNTSWLKQIPLPINNIWDKVWNNINNILRLDVYFLNKIYEQFNHILNNFNEFDIEKWLAIFSNKELEKINEIAFSYEKTIEDSIDKDDFEHVYSTIHSLLS